MVRWLVTFERETTTYLKMDDEEDPHSLLMQHVEVPRDETLNVGVRVELMDATVLRRELSVSLRRYEPKER